MLSIDVNREYGLIGEYLLEYCARYGEDYQKLESIKDSNPCKSELMYLYKNSSVSRYILNKIPKEEISNILFSVEQDFTEDWNKAGGGILNLEDIATVQLQQLWQLLYLILAVYIGKVESHETHIEPLRVIMHDLILKMQMNNLSEYPDSTTIH